MFIQNILSGMAFTIGALIIVAIVSVIGYLLQKRQQKTQANKIWLAIFQAAATQYLADCEAAEDYRELSDFQNLIQHFNELPLNQIQSIYQLEYVEKMFVDLQSGEVINRSFYKIVKTNNSS